MILKFINFLLHYYFDLFIFIFTFRDILINYFQKIVFIQRNMNHFVKIRIFYKFNSLRKKILNINITLYELIIIIIRVIYKKIFKN